MANLLLKGVAFLWDRRDKKKNAAVATPKKPTSPRNKLRLWLCFPLVLIFVAWILQFVLVFAGSKPAMLEEYAVFTLNVSRIGEGIHQDIDSAIAGVNFDALHINLKRLAPLNIPATVTAPPTTLITMAPRDVGSVFESLTEEAGDNLDSATSAVHSKASDVRSKASSAANAAESSVNSGIDNAAKKIKAKVTELVDETFKEMVSNLNLRGFYSIHVMTTCEGDYAKADNAVIATKKEGDKCEKGSPINPMKWVSIFYWAAIIFTGLAFVFVLLAILMPAGKWWLAGAVVSLLGSFFMMLVASALSHGIAAAAQRLTNFVGEGLSINGVAGQKFIALTWTTTIMLGAELVVVAVYKWYIGRNPDKAAKTSSGRLGGISISRPMQGLGDASIDMDNLAPSAPNHAYRGPGPYRPGRETTPAEFI